MLLYLTIDYIHTCTTAKAKKLPNVPRLIQLPPEEAKMLLYLTTDYIHTYATAKAKKLLNVPTFTARQGEDTT